MARRQVATELEDVTHLAGWMYADLLLALMVIFLATISFVPKFNNVSINSEKTLSTYTKLDLYTYDIFLQIDNHFPQFLFSLHCFLKSIWPYLF